MTGLNLNEERMGSRERSREGGVRGERGSTKRERERLRERERERERERALPLVKKKKSS